MKKKANNYEVGYGKPPKSGQFKKGQSGNKKGRPKKSRNLRIILNEVLDQKVSLRQNGIVKKMTLEEAFIKKLVEGALNGTMSDKMKFLKEITQLLPERYTVSERDNRIRVEYVLPNGKTMEDYEQHHENDNLPLAS